MIKVGKQEAETRLWHPNFGDTSTLPDIKVVRTGFFYSALALTAAVMVAMYVGFREHQMKTIEKNILVLEQEVQGYSKRHNAIIKQNRAFLDLKKKIDELKGFVGDQLVMSDFLLTISESLSEEMAISRVEYTPDSAVVSGIIHSESDDAARIFDAYRSRLSDANASQSLFDNYEAKSLKRNEDKGVLEFGIELSRTEEKPEGKDKKGA